MMRTRSSRRDRGGAALELALFAPVLLYLSLAVGDFARYYIASARLGDTATAAARAVAAGAPADAFEAVRVEVFCACPNDSERRFACGADSCGAYGEPARYVEALAEKPFSFVARYPGVPSALTMRRSAGVRVR